MPTSLLRSAVARILPAELWMPPSYQVNDTLISGLSYCAIGVELQSVTTSLASTAWPTSNRAIAFPFSIAERFVVKKVWWMNGTTATTNNADVGVYTEGGALLVSGGGTLIAGANILQEADVTDTLLRPGRYWCAYCQNGTTATPTCVGGSLATLRAVGLAQMASAYPLPATFVPAAMQTGIMPYFGIADRAQAA